MDTGDVLRHLLTTVADGTLSAAGTDLFEYLRRVATGSPALAGAMTADDGGQLDADALAGVVDALAKRDDRLASLLQSYAVTLANEGSTRVRVCAVRTE